MIQIVSPINGEVIAERQLAGTGQIQGVLDSAQAARKNWQSLSLEQRADYCSRAIDIMVQGKQVAGEELTRQMGRPIRYTPGEIDGLAERGRSMIGCAKAALADIPLPPKTGFRRFIRKQPLGTVFTIAPWNYPYLTAVNSIIPALMAGNTVILKHSAQTLLCAERFAAAFTEAGLPEGVFQFLHLDHEQTECLIQDRNIDFVSFTGSVAGGRAVETAAAGLFKGTALELGGKDPGYVMADANLQNAVDGLIDGAFFNSGQSCCGIERIYVHRSLYDDFVDAAVVAVNGYILGDPLHPQTTLGPMVNGKAANFVRQQIEAATAAGAKACINIDNFPQTGLGAAYLAPQLLINVDHSMEVMREETFGPLVGIMPVNDDDEAIRLMNDSPYGLTASLWSQDDEHALRVGDQVETGTVFLNRCDYLDPELAWVGVKDSGRGCSLSRLGYDQLTRPKSFHLKQH